MSTFGNVLAKRKAAEPRLTFLEYVRAGGPDKERRGKAVRQIPQSTDVVIWLRAAPQGYFPARYRGAGKTACKIPLTHALAMMVQHP